MIKKSCLFVLVLLVFAVTHTKARETVRFGPHEDPAIRTRMSDSQLEDAFLPGTLVIKLKKGVTKSKAGILTESGLSALGDVSMARAFGDAPDLNAVLRDLRKKLMARVKLKHLSVKEYEQRVAERTLPENLQSDSHAGFLIRIEREIEDLEAGIHANQRLAERLDRREKRTRVKKDSRLEDIYVITLPPDKTLEYYQKLKRQTHLFDYVELNVKAREDLIPDDPNYSSLWGLEKTACPSAWNVTTGRDDIIVVPIESGLDIDHSDLVDNLWKNEGEIPGNGIDDDGNGYVDDYDGIFFSSDIDYTVDLPISSHGTHVAGTMAARGNNALMITGVTWNCKIMPALGSYLLAKAAAIKYATDMGADVLNGSFYYIGHYQPLTDALEYAYSRGVVFVASAGNRNTRVITQVPAMSDKVLAVAASDSSDLKASFSNYGPKVDLIAPGVGIFSTLPGDNLGSLNGTSMAAPHVAGSVALLLSRNLDLHMADPVAHPLLSLEEVRQALRRGADDLTDPTGANPQLDGFDVYAGYGRLNAAGALNQTGFGEARLFFPQPENHIVRNYDFAQGGKYYFNAWTIVSGQVDIRGIANSRRFSHFTLEIGQGHHPQSWQHLITSTTPVTGADGETLVYENLDTDTLANGPHTMRLRVWDDDNEVYEDRMMITIARALITNIPAENHELNLNPILFWDAYDIRGFARGPGFVSYHFEYGPGREPVSWTRATDDITVPSEDGGLLFDNLDFTPMPDGIVTLKLVVEDSLLGTSEHSIVIDKDATNFPYQSGFPKIADDENFSERMHAPPVIADIDQDGRDELIVLTSQQLMAYRHDGTFLLNHRLSGWAKDSAPAVGNLDADPELEIALRDDGKIKVVNPDGTFLEPWSDFSLEGSKPGAQNSVVLYDLDHDGDLEVIATEIRDNTGYLHAFRADGAPLQGWEGGKELDAVAYVSPVAGNLDAEGLSEIVVRDNMGTVKAFNADGTLKWSVSLADSEGQGPYPRLALADTDGDGRLEAVTFKESPSGIAVIDHQGNVLLDREVFSLWHRAFAIGDLDQNGRLDIVFPYLRPVTGGYEGGVCAYDLVDGAALPGWPATNNGIRDNYLGNPVIGDVDDDGEPEVLIPEYGRINTEIFVIDADGRMETAQEYPMRKRGFNFAGSALGDLDKDGDVEYAFAGQMYGIYVYDLPHAYNEGSIQWGRFQHDHYNTGNYNFPQTQPPLPEMAVKQETAVIESGTGSHDFGSVAVGAQGDAVTFNIENTGSAELLLGDTPPVVITGADAAEFSVVGQPVSNIAPGGIANFDIRFSPVSPGAKQAVVSIGNNDANENPYTFAVTGTGVQSLIGVNLISNPDAADGTTSWTVIITQSDPGADAGTLEMGSSVFFVQNHHYSGTEMRQTIEIPEAMQGRPLYALQMVYAWGQDLIEGDTRSRRPWLEVNEYGSDWGLIAGHYVFDEHTVPSETWQPVGMIWPLDSRTEKVIFSLLQMQGTAGFNGTKSCFDDCVLAFFESEADAIAYRDHYLSEHPDQWESPDNLVKNPGADQGLNQWEVTTTSPESIVEVVAMESGDKAFAMLPIDGGAYIKQDIWIPEEMVGKPCYLISLGYVWGEDFSVSRPYFITRQYDENGVYLYGLGSSPNDHASKQWHVQGGSIQPLQAETRRVNIWLDKQGGFGKRLLYDDMFLGIFPSEADAEAYRNKYIQAHPDLDEDIVSAP